MNKKLFTLYLLLFFSSLLGMNPNKQKKTSSVITKNRLQYIQEEEAKKAFASMRIGIDLIHEEMKPYTHAVVKRMTFEKMLHNIRVSEQVNMLIRRWMFSQLLEATHKIILKQESYEMLYQLPIPPTQKAKLMEQKIRDIQKIISDAHKYLVLPLAPFKSKTDEKKFVGVFEDDNQANIYGAILAGQALVLNE